METKKPVEVTVRDHVMQIRLNRPEDENRINREAMQMIGQALERAKPVYTYMKGWQCDISGCRKACDLPEAARQYIRFIEKELDCPIQYVSVGADREAYLVME